MATCACGSTWFHLRGRPGTDDLEDGAVCVNERGAVVAYTGQLVCVECGQTAELARPRLSVVE